MCLIGLTADKHWPKLCNLCLSGLTGLSEARLYFIENLISLKACFIVYFVLVFVQLSSNFSLSWISHPLRFTKTVSSFNLCDLH